MSYGHTRRGAFGRWVREEQRQGTTRVLVDGLTPEDQTRLFRLGRELRLMNQMLSYDLDTLSIVDDGPAAAWTTLEGDHISFNKKQMPMPNSKYDLAVWLGTNAHELGHVLFTPRKSSLLMRRVKQAEEVLMPGLHRVWNVVEDQRQERLLIARFAPWRAYLIAALGKHLKFDTPTAWILFAGRTWMPVKARQVAYDRSVAHWGQAVTDQLGELIGQFQVLPDPGEYDADAAFRIIERIYELVGAPADTGGCAGGEITDGEADVSEPSEDAPEPAKGNRPCEEGDKAEGDAESDEDSEGGSGAGKESSGKKHDDPLTNDEIKKLLEEAVKEAIENDKELDHVSDALDTPRGGQEVEGGMPIGRMVDATDRARYMWHEVGDALLDLKDRSEPAWIKRVDSGRLNVGRLAQGCDPEELFDRYEPGQMDASDLELCLLVDVSGSMGAYCLKLGEAIWAMRRAVDDLEGTMTVISYEGGMQHQIICRPGERPDERMFVPQALGGTEPTSAIEEAWKVLSESEARNVLLVVLTDGHWYTRRGDQIIASMNNRGVTTVMARLGARGDLEHGELHGCHYGTGVNDPQALAMLFRRIAVERIASWM
jgi:hypothetical protein